MVNRGSGTVRGRFGRGLVSGWVKACIVVAFVSTSIAQTAAPAAGRGKMAASATGSAAQSGTPLREASRPGAEGIKVHGWWTLTVRNADGSIARHQEFENGLSGFGPLAISSLILGTGVAGGLDIAFDSADPAKSICNAKYCHLLDTTTGPQAQRVGCTGDSRVYCYGGLSVSQGPGYSGSIILAGSMKALQAGVVDSVRTIIFQCNSVQYQVESAHDCYAQPVNSIFFTQTNAASNPAFTPFNINAGQTVDVTVTLSFS